MSRLHSLTSERGRALLLAAALVAALVATLVWVMPGDDRRVTAYFSSASGLYEGNPVEVLGVPVGSVASVVPEPGRVKVVIELDDDVDLPADVSALQVSPSLISGRSITLAPAYTGGPRLEDGAVIPIERTRVPLDVNDLATNADALAAALGPQGANKDGALTRALDVLAANLDGNGAALADTIRALSGATGTLSGSREDLAGTVTGLQGFVSTLAADDPQVRELNARLADVAGFLADDRQDLGAALDQLSTSLGDVAGFVRENRSALRTNVDRLSRVTTVLVRNRAALAQILDEAPTGLGNLFNAYDAAGGTLDVRLVLDELTLGPGALLCELIARGSPTDIPKPLATLCSTAGGALDGLGIPPLADVITALQTAGQQLGGGR
ncbi:MCE family protein [Nocardioides sp.]|uniref:MCE family protein n=1 Tax=Nocardioides sp. TaxID=35761 RepID=UPI003519D7AD